MTQNYMNWRDRLDELNQSSNFADLPTALDLATAPWSQARDMQPQSGVPSLAELQLQGQADRAHAPTFMSMVGDTVGSVSDILHLGDPVFNLLAMPYKWTSTNVLSPLVHIPLTMQSDSYLQKWGGKNPWDQLTSGDWWSGKTNGKNDSVGRGVLENLYQAGHVLSGADIRDGKAGMSPGDMQNIQSHWGFNFMSGTNDLAANIFLDPLLVVGKFAKFTRVLRYTDDLARAMNPTRYDKAVESVAVKVEQANRSRQGLTGPGPREAFQKDRTLANLTQSDPVQRFLKWTDGKSARTIAYHPAIKDSPQAGLIADLLARSTWQDKQLVYRIGVGDRTAEAELSSKAPDVLAKLKRLRADHAEWAAIDKIYNSPLSSIPEREARAALDGHIRDNQATLRMYGPGGSEFQPNAAPGVTHPLAGTLPDGTPNRFAVSYQYADQAHIHNSFLPIYVGQDKIGLVSPRGERITQEYLDSLDYMSKHYRAIMDHWATQQGHVVRPLRPMPGGAGEVGPGASMPTPIKNPEIGPKQRPADLTARNAAARADKARGSGLVYPAKGAPDYRYYTLDDAFDTHTGRIPGQTDLFGQEYIPGEVADAGARIKALREQAQAGSPAGIPGSAKSYRQALKREEGQIQSRVANLKASKRMVTKPSPLPPAPENVMQHWVTSQDGWGLHYDYGIGEVANQAKQIQLNVFDDLVGDELRLANEHLHWYQSALQAAKDAEHIPLDLGVFNTLGLVPKGRLKATRAMQVAENRATKDAQYSLGGQKAVKTMAENKGIDYTPPSRVYDGKLGKAMHLIHPVPRVIGEAFKGMQTPIMYNPNDLEAWRDLDLWLKRVKGLPGDIRQTWVNEHMGITDPAAKLKHVEQVEADTLMHMINGQGGISPRVARYLTQRTIATRQALVDWITGGQVGPMPKVGISRGSEEGVYAAKNSGDIRPDIIEKDGSVGVATPVFRDQLVNNHPLLPVEKIQRAIWEDRHLLRGPAAGLENGLSDAVMNGSSWMNQIWKGLTLARPGYVARTFSDEAMIALAAMDGMTMLGQGFKGAGNRVRNIADRSAKARRAALRANKKLAKARLAPIHEVPQLGNQLGTKPFETGFGPDFLSPGLYQGARADINRGLTGASQQALLDLYGSTQGGLRKKADSWGSLDPQGDEEAHISAWIHALNNVFGRDKLARMALNGNTTGDMVKFLRSPAGRQYAKGNKLMDGNWKSWAERVQQMVGDYTLNSPQLRELALNHGVTGEHLKSIPIDARPQVHGGEIDYTMGGFKGTTDRILSSFYRLANEMPTNTLVRHPMADMVYRQKVQEMVAAAKAQGVDPAMNPEEIYRIEGIARQHTIKHMKVTFKDNLFSSPAGAMKFISPFFGAWRGSIARWARMIGEDPSILTRAGSSWQALHKGFDVVDSNGNPIDSNTVLGYDTDAKIILRAPEWAVKRLGINYSPAKMVPLKSFNTWLGGDDWFNPGAGPFITIPVAEWLRHDPTPMALHPLEDKALRVSGVLPYGPQDIRSQLLPRVFTNIAKVDDMESMSMRVNLWRAGNADYLMGNRKAPPTMSEVRDQASWLGKLDAMAKWISPVSIQDMYYGKDWEHGQKNVKDQMGNDVLGPDGKPVRQDIPKDYQFLVGKYRDLRDKFGNKQATDVFLQEYPEAFAYLDSVSQNVSGIPANMSSWRQASSVKKWMTKAPDIFQSVAGITDSDKDSFDKDVYAAQLREEFNHGTGQKMRGPADITDFTKDAYTRQGWREFGKIANEIDNLLVAIPPIPGSDPSQPSRPATLDDPQAAGIANLRKLMVSDLADKYPDWYRDYVTPNLDRQAAVLSQAQAVADDPKMDKRLDIQGLKTYMADRADLVALLKARGALPGGSYDLSAKSNQGLMNLWQLQRSDLMANNTAFAELWLHRYFENDNLQEVR